MIIDSLITESRVKFYEKKTKVSSALLEAEVGKIAEESKIGDALVQYFRKNNSPEHCVKCNMMDCFLPKFIMEPTQKIMR